MNTITAKELRDNLGNIVQRVQAGEHIRVKYRNTIAFKLSPQDRLKTKQKRLAGLEAFLAAPKTPSPFDQNKSAKQLYREHMEEKYGK